MTVFTIRRGICGWSAHHLNKMYSSFMICEINKLKHILINNCASSQTFFFWLDRMIALGKYTHHTVLWYIESNKSWIRADIIELFCCVVSGGGVSEVIRHPRMEMPLELVLMLLPGNGSWWLQSLWTPAVTHKWSQSEKTSAGCPQRDWAGSGKSPVQLQFHKEPPGCAAKPEVQMRQRRTPHSPLSTSCSYSASQWLHAGHAGGVDWQATVSESRVQFSHVVSWALHIHMGYQASSMIWGDETHTRFVWQLGIIWCGCASFD